ncbi:MAG: helix-turn-helix domain-containing protein [Candidatus Berkelbacteria bacterium]
MTVKEVAEILKVNKMTIYRYIKAGKIEAIKIGKDFRITHAQFDIFIETMRNHG